jgi:Xaa-Pro aminopeptidase
MINEKIHQAFGILKEKDIDFWLTFARETSSTPDPALEIILGTHVVWPAAFILTASGKATAIVGSLDAQNVKDHADYEVIGYVDSIKDELLKALNKHNPKRIAVNYSPSDVTADGLTHGMYLILSEYLQETPYLERLQSAETIIAALRGRKSPAEIQRIRSAIDETLIIFEEVTGFVKPGHTEQDVQAFIRGKMEERDLESAWDPEHCPAVFTGPESAGAHAGPTRRKIEPGHLMNIDFGVRKEGYVSDLQRTWYFLKPGEKETPEDVHCGLTTIREAIREAAKALKPGKEGREIDAVARSHIVDAGYEEYPHALGHQVGRKAHDGSTLLCPEWDRYKELPYSKVEVGQVFTLEPRLTVEGRGVATIEEIVVVTEKGCEFLSRPQESVILIPPQ